MTNQEAYDILTHRKSLSEFGNDIKKVDDYISKLCQAEKMAIQALELRIKEDKQNEVVTFDAPWIRSSSVVPKSCQHCPNHPQNGGSGVCYCVLGTQTIY